MQTQKVVLYIICVKMWTISAHKKWHRQANVHDDSQLYKKKEWRVSTTWTTGIIFGLLHKEVIHNIEGLEQNI